MLRTLLALTLLSTCVPRFATAQSAPVVPLMDAHFFIDVPVARPINPVTKTDWEGTGVAPDYKTSRDQALPTAIKLAETKLQTEDHSAAGAPVH